jgi:hypothetical protein
MLSKEKNLAIPWYLLCRIDRNQEKRMMNKVPPARI